MCIVVLCYMLDFKFAEVLMASICTLLVLWEYQIAINGSDLSISLFFRVQEIHKLSNLQRTRKILSEKIEQLNSAIDDISAQLRTEDSPNGVAVSADEIEATM